MFIQICPKTHTAFVVDKGALGQACSDTAVLLCHYRFILLAGTP
jgi:hypothetical protein